MPPAGKLDNHLLRTLCFGPAKMKKTWWALRAAEAGFNVILLDGDDGSQIITQIAPEFLPKINVIKIVDKQNMPVMCEFVTRFLVGKEFMWDEENKSILLLTNSAKPDRSYYIINPKKLTSNDIVIFDSWTALCWSLAWRWYKENNIKVEAAEQVKNSDQLWPGYRWSGAMASWMLKQVKTLPCHVIVIGHQSVYEKRRDEVINGKVKQVVEWSRTQAKSTSGPHGLELAKEFADILFFGLNGARFTIDTRPMNDRDGGCRFIPPFLYEWKDLQINDILEISHLPLPDKDAELEALTWYASGDDLPEGKIVTQGNSGALLEAHTAQKREKGKPSFANLLKPKKA